MSNQTPVLAILNNQILINNKNKSMTPNKIERQACEVYSRVVGYLRPVGQWNKGKQMEFADRQEYDKQLRDNCC